MPKNRLIVVALAILMTLGVASPAAADCCDTFWDCAATVVTEGVSCAVQEFIDTVKGLISFIKNLGDQASGITASASDAAKSAVNEMIATMTMQATNSTVDAEAGGSGWKAVRGGGVAVPGADGEDRRDGADGQLCDGRLVLGRDAAGGCKTACAGEEGSTSTSAACVAWQHARNECAQHRRCSRGATIERLVR